MLIALFAIVQVGFAHVPRSGALALKSRGLLLASKEADAANSRQPTQPLVFTSTSVIKSVHVSTSVVETPTQPPDTPSSTPSLSPTASRTPTRPATPTLTRTARPTDTETPVPTEAVSLQAASGATITATQWLTVTSLLTSTAAQTATATPEPTATPTPTPLPTPDGQARSAHVPILMYHYVSVPPAGADRYRVDLSVTPEQFEEQLAWLRSQGYQSISLFDLVDYMAQGKPLPEKPVVLTFDDGYRDAYTNAFPLLEQYGYTGTFFLITRPIDENNVSYLSWDMVKEMHAGGMDMQAHGYSHADLRGKSVDYLVYEIVGAKEAIEARTGETVRFFCYPSGSYDQQTIDVLRSANFWAATTTQQGATQSSNDLFELKRIRMRGEHSLDDFEELLTANW